MKTLHFVIEASFIIKLARDMFWCEQKYKYAHELLLNCMCGSDFTNDEINELISDIILGKKKLVGNSNDGFYLEDDNMDPKTEYCTMKYLADFRSDELPNLVKRTFHVAENDKKLKKSSNSSDDYGWLSPDGTFYPSDFGSHGAWAMDYIFCEVKKGNTEGLENWITRDCKDILIEKGWILIHNPSQFHLEVTGQEYRFTKKQREFLFNYFYERGQMGKAKEYLNEE